MARMYEDLSRRALIKLDHDYDDAEGEALKKYLEEHDEEYEGIRTIEAVTEKMDELGQKVSESGSAVKKLAMKELNKVVDHLIDSIEEIVQASAE